MIADASVAVKLLWEEPDSSAARNLLERHPAGWVAPSLLAYEVGNAVRFTRALVAPADRAAALRDFRALGITYVEPTAEDLDRALGLALEKGVTVYDAVYLALAERVALPLVTADRTFASKVRHGAVRRLGADPPP